MRCEYCDNEMPQDMLRCPSCGATAKTQGVSLASSPNSSIAPPGTCLAVPMTCSIEETKSRSAYILLGIFLGWLGIHNFYAGRTNRALGQLLTTVLTGWLMLPLVAVGIWVLSDICIITTDGKGHKFS